MLRAVLSEVEVVLSSSSNLRGPGALCGHPFEFDCGNSVAAVRSVIGARPEVERGVLPDAGRGCLSAQADRVGLGFEDRSSEAGRLSTPAKARGLQASWSKAESVCERSPSLKLPKQRAAQPAPPADAYRRFRL
jgi:hypothetical protein